MNQIIIIANVSPKSVHGYQEQAFNEANFQAWARLSVNGTDETQASIEMYLPHLPLPSDTVEGIKKGEQPPAPKQSLKALWMPFRSPQGWADYANDGKLYENRMTTVKKVKLEDNVKYDQDGNITTIDDKIDYFSVDNDWVNAEASDKARC